VSEDYFHGAGGLHLTVENEAREAGVDSEFRKEPARALRAVETLEPRRFGGFLRSRPERVAPRTLARPECSRQTLALWVRACLTGWCGAREPRQDCARAVGVLR